MDSQVPVDGDLPQKVFQISDQLLYAGRNVAPFPFCFIGLPQIGQMTPQSANSQASDHCAELEEFALEVWISVRSLNLKEYEQWDGLSLSAQFPGSFECQNSITAETSEVVRSLRLSMADRYGDVFCNILHSVRNRQVTPKSLLRNKSQEGLIISQVLR